ncbi:TonB-dependent receptor domain-containing protein [Sphingomonas sp. BK345]|uniref:TonB-dependent receptor domain-containing protein n=1 Tax=Sphingomonas sp. BK345 TaxID=2586980 RepID=UPI00161B7635|nr:TonB-dependent receptor [Sphingomonas sp. BK345]MBB3475277.1 outer membrane receptor protein involved in Fe transport [Sphingomonas sp. BK345]
MRFKTLLLAAAAIVVPAHAFAQATTNVTTPSVETTASDQRGATETPHRDVVVTAVARGRDRLDTAVSTSQLLADDIDKIAPRSLAEVFRNIPGIRSESSSGEGGANLSIRGLPMATGGGKYLQLQEDGLPVLEYGDIAFANADMFMRADLNLAAIASIRGGSASTFASNSPGGVINLISKTGETEGGAVQLLEGLDYGEHRLDVDYGGRLGDDWRYHFGGFVRVGEGPRRIGYDGNRGGQFKLNLTREFAGGYVRLYGKVLDDGAVGYAPNPVRVTGSDASPHYQSLPGFDIAHDALFSRYALRVPTLDGDNRYSVYDERHGRRSTVQSFGVEAQATLAGFTVIDRFRYSHISGRIGGDFPESVGAASEIAATMVKPAGTLRYATGPNAGVPITDPTALSGGNGLLARMIVFNTKLNDLGNVFNDLRGSRVDPIGPGELTSTLGLYNSRQDIHTDWLWASRVMEVRGGGNATLVDVLDADGVAQTQEGVYGYGASFFGDCCRRRHRVDYFTNAPFGSLNYKLGRVSIGASLRYDLGHAEGLIAGSDLYGKPIPLTSRDMNGDGVIAPAEERVAYFPAGFSAPVDYDWHYLSYSSGINFRLAEPFAIFARYSRGGRTNADRLLFNPANMSLVTGRLTKPNAAVDRVEQVEGGFKFRRAGTRLDLTGFWAQTGEQNAESTHPGVFVDRVYRAHGVEGEGSLDLGVFRLSAGGTYTDSKIVADQIKPITVGNVPRRQARFIYQATPELALGPIELGANVVGTTSSFTDDTNQLKLPAFTTVGAFATWHLGERLQLSVNSNNLFDQLGFTEAEDAAIPANGIVRARAINGRTTSLALRLLL